MPAVDAIFRARGSVTGRCPLIAGWLVLLWIGLAVSQAASPATNAAQGRERDLGQGLAYFRLHSLPADLPPPESGRVPPCVVDLRYLRTEPAGVTAFTAWIRGRASERTPVFILANAETERALLDSGVVTGSVLTIGIPRDGFQPDVPVSATPQDERRAYDAFESGATISSLVTDNPGKDRYDETSLGKDRRAESTPRRAADGLPKDTATPPPIDAVMQRAVHLHRGLLALGRLQG